MALKMYYITTGYLWRYFTRKSVHHKPN